MCQHKSETSVHFLQQKFFAFEKEPNESIAVFVSRLQELAQQLKDLQEPVSDKMLMKKILMSPSLKHFHSAWPATEENKKTVNELVSRLMVEKTRATAFDSSEDREMAFMAKKARKDNKNYSQSHSQSQKGESRRRGKCFRCGSDSHWRRDCPEKSNINSNSNAKSHEKRRNEALCSYILDKDKNNSVMISTSSKCVIKRSGSIVAVGYRQTGLYKMCIKPIQTEQYANAAVSSLRIWHERLAHQNVKQVKHILNKNDIEYIDDKNFQGEACIYVKHHRLLFGHRDLKSEKCGEVIHTDVCGPMKNSIGGSRYFLLLKDDHSHFRFVYFIQKKSDVPSKIMSFIKFVHTQTDHKIKVMRSDNGTKYTNTQLKTFFEQHGIRFHTHPNKMDRAKEKTVQ